MEDAVSASCLSPSLMPAAKTCYEAKFLADEDVVARMEDVLAERLTLDPHVGLGERSYEVETVYFDTADFAVHRKAPGFRSTKHRVRRYGVSESVFLERKSKSSGRVRKLRTAVPLDALHDSSDATWFHARIAARQLRPVCRIAYERTAYFGEGDTGPLRITFDRRLWASPVDSVDFDGEFRPTPLPIQGVIVEMKFTTAMPTLFKSAVQHYGLAPTSASKYRTAVETLRLHHAGERRHA